MARNAIKNYFHSSKMAAGGHFVNEKRNCCNLFGVHLGIDWTTVHLKCSGSIRYPLNEYKTSTKFLTFCRHYPGATKWPACKPFGDTSSIFPQANTAILVIIYNELILISIYQHICAYCICVKHVDSSFLPIRQDINDIICKTC